MSALCACGHQRAQHRRCGDEGVLVCASNDGCTCEAYKPMRVRLLMWQDELHSEELREMEREVRRDRW